MRLDGNKIYLRTMEIEDTPMVVAWRNKDHVRNNFLYQRLLTEADHLNWIKTKVLTGEVVQFIIIDKENDTPVGSVYLRDIDNKQLTAEYGIFIGEESALGKGYGSECARLMTLYAKNELKLKKLFLRFVEGNVAAQKSYESAGFVLEDRTENNVSELTKESRRVMFMERIL